MKFVGPVSVASVLLSAAVRAAEERAGHNSVIGTDELSNVLCKSVMSKDDMLRARLVCKHWMSLINVQFCSEMIGENEPKIEEWDDWEQGIIHCQYIWDLKHAAQSANEKRIPITPLWRGIPVRYREIRGLNPESSSEKIRFRLHSKVPSRVTEENLRFSKSYLPLMDDKMMISDCSGETFSIDVNTGEVEEIPLPFNHSSLRKRGVDRPDLRFNINLPNLLGKTDEWIVYSWTHGNYYLKHNPDQDRLTKFQFFEDESIHCRSYLSDDQSTLIACEQYKDEQCIVDHVIDTGTDQIQRSLFLPFLFDQYGPAPVINPPWFLFKAGTGEGFIRLINLETGDQIQLDGSGGDCVMMDWINDELFIFDGGQPFLNHIRSVKDPHSDLVQFTSLCLDEDQLRPESTDFISCSVTAVARDLLVIMDNFIKVERE